MANNVPLPAPFKGVDSRTPLIALQSPSARTISNFHTAPEGLVLRRGDKKYNKITFATGADASNRVLALTSYGDTKLILVAFSFFDSWVRFYDADTGAVDQSVATVSTSDVQTLYFNNYLYFFTNDLAWAPGQVYNASAGTYGAIGYIKKTGVAGLFRPFGGNVYKNRAYMLQKDEPAFWYSGIDEISGECPKRSLASLTNQPSNLSAICSFTLSDQVSAQEIQCFVFFNGEVLFYTGSYPDGSDWTSVGRAVIAPTLYFNSVITVGGDSYVLTDTGLYSMRALFAQGSEASSVNSFSENIDKEWTNLVSKIRVATGIASGALDRFIKSAYDKVNSRIVIEFPYFLLVDGTLTEGSTTFEYDISLGSWTVLYRNIDETYGSRDIVYYKNKLLQLWQNATTGAYIAERETATGFTDRDVTDSLEIAYSYQVVSAPISNGKGLTQTFLGFDVFLESDLFTETNYRAIINLGVSNSAYQATTALTTGLQMPFVNVGAEGCYMQYEIIGQTAVSKTVGMTIYGFNIWKEDGQTTR